MHTQLRVIRNWMHTRCNNPKMMYYKNYGGRGITLCPEWTGTSKHFIAWALTNGYSEGLTIDRIDNDKGYSPDNCRWVTAAENSQNRRKPNTNTTGYIGVVQEKAKYRKGFRIHLRVDGKVLLSSRHTTALEAAQIREAFIIKNGLNSTLNFTKEPVPAKD